MDTLKKIGFLAIVGALAAVQLASPVSPVTAQTGATDTDDWARVKAAGKILVGTSADYAPFEFYDTNYQLDGFDIALFKAIGKTLSLTVVAEGVETIEQQSFLRGQACDEMQGYYFSKPIVAEEFAALLRGNTIA